jgi:tRNA threonylcarbamoyladenosine modification (KEOPS) complex Cgi121 subunit
MPQILKIKDSTWTMSIGGFNNVTIGFIEDFLSNLETMIKPCLFQVFDADSVAGWQHLYISTVNAVKAFERGYAISRRIAIEALLYASCQDQISMALKVMGISSSTKKIALLILATKKQAVKEAFAKVEKTLGFPDDSVLEINENKFHKLKDRFGIGDLEFSTIGGSSYDALTRLILERGALLPLRK